MPENNEEWTFHSPTAQLFLKTFLFVVILEQIMFMNKYLRTFLHQTEAIDFT